MAIRLPELDSVVDELSERLIGARLQEIRVPAAGRLVLTLRGRGETLHLLFVVQSIHARVHLVDRPPRNPVRSLAVQGLLRSLLRGGCNGFERVAGDRIIRMGLVDHVLLAELTGRHGNLFILDREDRIVASLLPNHSHKRLLNAGAIYIEPASDPPPPRPARFEPPDISGQLDQHYSQLEAGETGKALRTTALRRLRGVAKKVRRKADRQRKECDRADQIGLLRREADLLNASFHQLSRGPDRVELPDIFEDDAPGRTVTLDPARTPRQEIDGRYRKAKRLERGMIRARTELARTEAELERVEGALERVEAAADEAALEGVLAELPPPWRPQAAPARRRKSPERRPFWTYSTPGGQRILVGRSGADNDTLTFRHAKGRDVWLHVTGGPGAHVVIPLDGTHVDPTVLDLAAQLVLAHSGVAEGDREEVAWTRVKYVRKVKGAPPGLVTFSQEKRMLVERDRSALEGVVRENP